jgi:glycosyltransferase involved in cell wall biosynthesis
MIHVAHVIKSLEIGGAETVLERLIERADDSRFRWHVFSLTSIGPIGERLKAHGIPVEALNISGPGYLLGLQRLARRLRVTRPDVVQTWMYHADLIGGLAAKRAGIHNIVWALHAGSPPVQGASIPERIGLRLNSRLSHRIPKKIICCSHTTARVHAAIGYERTKMVIVPNGFEIPDAQVVARGDLGLPTGSPLVIRVGRNHPDKDIPSFLTMVAILNQRSPVDGVLVGPGLDRENHALVDQVRTAGLEGKIHLLGPRSDVRALIMAADVAVSSSSGGEGLPLTIGEAMAVATPVVATDVGDSALILDDPQRIVAPRRPMEMAAAVEKLLTMSPEKRALVGARDQRRVRDRWTLGSMVNGYCDQYLRLVGEGR